MIAAILGFGHAALAQGAPYGVYAFITANKTVPSGIYTDSSVTGITLATSWSLIEPTQGAIQYSFLDDQIAQATSYGRKVALRVQAGVYAPKWLYAAGADSITFRWYLNSVFPLCSTQTMPVPWDPVYLANWSRVVAALGARYANNPDVTMVKMDGINSITGEMLLAYSAGTHTLGDGSCGAAPILPASTWKAAGYTPDNVVAAWNTITDTYARSFPTQQLALETGTFWFPPIDNTGSIIAGSSGDTKLVQTLDQVASQAAGARLVLQSDGLSTQYIYNLPPTVPPTTLRADQPATRVTTDTACRDNGGIQPCDPATVTRQMMAKARASGAEFVEMFPIDLQNPALAGPIASFYP